MKTEHSVIFITAPHQISNSENFLRRISSIKFIVRLGYSREIRYYREIISRNPSWKFEFYRLRPTALPTKKVIFNLKMLKILILRGALSTKLLIGDARTVPGRSLIQIRRLLGLTTEILSDGNYILNYAKNIDFKNIIIHSELNIDLKRAKLARIKTGKSNKKQNLVYMLGNALIEYQYCDPSVYLEVVREMHETHGDRLKYYPHRAESLSPALKSMLGSNLIKPIMPFEKYVEQTGRPSEVHGFCSSALLNLRETYDDIKIVAHKIPMYIEDKTEAKAISQIYEIMEARNIEIRNHV